MNEENEFDWLQRTSRYAHQDLDKVRDALEADRVEPDLLFRHMEGALGWAVKYWLVLEDEEPGVDWINPVKHFLRVAHPELSGFYLLALEEMEALKRELRNRAGGGSAEIAMDDPSLGSWREKLASWVDLAESMIREFTGPSPVDEPRFKTSRPLALGQIQGRLEGLMPSFLLAQAGGTFGRWPRNEETPGLFVFREADLIDDSASFHKGILLPIAFCRDPLLRDKLSRFSELVREGIEKGMAHAARHRRFMQAWLDREELGYLRIVDKEPVRRWIRLELSREVFPRLLSQLDYVTSLLDGPDLPCGTLERTAFPWSSYGGFLEWCIGYNAETALYPFHLFLATEVEKAENFSLGSSDRSRFRRPPDYWSRFTIPSPDAETSLVTVRFTQDQVYGWAELEMVFGDRKALVTLSNAYDPFPPLLEWLRMVMEDDLPIAIDIDEEGSVARVSAHAFDETRILVAVVDHYDEIARAEAVVEREDFLSAFRTEYLRFFRQEFSVDDWIGDWPEEDVARYLDALLNHPFLSGSRGTEE